MTQIPLVFHYVGNVLPAYADTALRHALKEWPGRVVLIHNRPLSANLAGVEVVHPEQWYDNRQFEAWSARTAMQRDFRDGFWFHAVERFFMLEQWANTFEVPRFLHCELDVAIYRSSSLVEVLERLPNKLFFPRASPAIAGANWLFCSSKTAMSELTKFLETHSGDEFEMAVLAKFMDEFPDSCDEAPSHYSLQRAEELGDNRHLAKLKEWGGIIDVHPIGTWLLGRDPRNVNTFLNYNQRYYDRVGSEFLTKLRFGFDKSFRCVTAGTDDIGYFPVFALHVHSKQLGLSYKPTYLRLVTLLSRLPFAMPLSAGNFEVAFPKFIKRFSDPIYRMMRS